MNIPIIENKYYDEKTKLYFSKYIFLQNKFPGTCLKGLPISEQELFRNNFETFLSNIGKRYKPIKIDAEALSEEKKEYYKNNKEECWKEFVEKRNLLVSLYPDISIKRLDSQNSQYAHLYPILGQLVQDLHHIYFSK